MGYNLDGLSAKEPVTGAVGLAVVFRSGANQFHGSLEDRYLNNTLLHRDYFDTLLPPPETYHELSAVLSGPVFIPKIYKRIEFSDPNRSYNVATLSTIGRMTATRGSFGDVGGRTYWTLVGRIEW